MPFSAVKTMKADMERMMYKLADEISLSMKERNQAATTATRGKKINSRDQNER